MTMIYTIMATVMLGKIIVEAIRLLWGPVPFSVPGFLIGTVKAGDVVISIANIAIIAAVEVPKALSCIRQNRERPCGVWRRTGRRPSLWGLM